eukprot:TRINITY_DN7459_c0_g2_i2.p1 TRINITY_DN7459_c0_g2~~TRINITY_DN7459_c0_g2_i2.p1  ORF type:complete len:111 (+),score=30.10 TRINITY_DN7459_c0_g2_i2:149-481(+)
MYGRAALRPVSRRSLSVIPAPRGAARVVYRQFLRSTPLYWTSIVAFMALGGYVFDEATLWFWESHNKGKLFKDVIGKFPEKAEEEEEEEDAPAAEEEAAAAPAEAAEKEE